jgi:hypothetical protein
VNRVGYPIIIITPLVFFAFIFSAWFEKMDWPQIILFFAGIIFFMVLGISFIEYKNYERATLHFIPEGIIINAKIGFIPLKYEDIKLFKSLNITKQDNTKEFSIITNDAREYYIKKTDIYDGLIHVFPDKDGSFLS